MREMLFSLTVTPVTGVPTVTFTFAEASVFLIATVTSAEPFFTPVILPSSVTETMLLSELVHTRVYFDTPDTFALSDTVLPFDMVMVL